MKGMTKTKYPNVYYYVSEKKRYDGKPDMCFYYSYNEQAPGAEQVKPSGLKRMSKLVGAVKKSLLPLQLKNFLSFLLSAEMEKLQPQHVKQRG